MICCFTSKEYLVVEEILRLFYLKWRLIKNLIFKEKKKKDSTSEERVLLQNAKHCSQLYGLLFTLLLSTFGKKDSF